MIKRSVTAACGVVIGIGLLGACGGTSSDEATAAPTVVVTATATATVTADPTTPPPSPVKAPRPKPQKKTAKPKPVVESYTMPNELGNVLQSAQEDIEGILGVPFWPLLKSHDVKEGYRFQVLDRDWKVCNQRPAPGASFDDSTIIDFGVVKLDERCP